MEEIIINKIEWKAPEYKHKEKSIDFLWAIGSIALVMCGFALWQGSYLFAIFIVISAFSLILFSVRPPLDIVFTIETSGLSLGKDKYEWKNIKGFHINKYEDEAKLLIEINKYLLPIYTIPVPLEKVDDIRENLIKVTPNIDLEESKSMKFMESIGF